MKPITVGELAKRAAVGVETVRFYEKQGLLEQPKRKESGYRQYDEDTVQILLFIRRAKELGFTLKEIKTLLVLQSNIDQPRSEIRLQASEKIAEIDARIADLFKMRNSLQSLVEQCDGDGTLAGCPIMNALHGTDPNQV
jgi:Hg(II)-responsive transcriptional regulator